MSETPHLDPEEGVRALILKWIDAGRIGNPTGWSDPGTHVGEWLETGLAARAPYISVDLIGGPQDYFGNRPVLQLDFFAPRRADPSMRVKSIAADTALCFLRYPDSVPVGDRIFQIDSVYCLQQPTKADWDDENIRRMSARYELSVRR